MRTPSLLNEHGSPVVKSVFSRCSSGGGDSGPPARSLRCFFSNKLSYSRWSPLMRDPSSGARKRPAMTPKAAQTTEAAADAVATGSDHHGEKGRRNNSMLGGPTQEKATQ